MGSQGPSVSQETAEATATRIREYWAAKGWVVRTRVEYTEGNGQHRDSPGWVVRTDMLDGWPVRRIAA